MKLWCLQEFQRAQAALQNLLMNDKQRFILTASIAKLKERSPQDLQASLAEVCAAVMDIIRSCDKAAKKLWDLHKVHTS